MNASHPSPATPEWLHALLQQSLLGAYEIGPDLRFRYVSARCAEILQRPAEELLALPSCLDVVAPEERDRVRGVLLGRLAGRSEPPRYGFRVCPAGGAEIPVEVQECAFEREGRPALAGVMLDVTERSELEAQLRRSQRMEAVGELTGGVAHDFNNLLTAMLAPVELVIAELGEAHPLSSHLIQVRRTVLRAAALTRQLLHYSRRRVHRAEVVRLGELVEEMRPLLEGIAGEAVRLELSVQGGVPNVRVDPIHFEQVLVNLLVNARDAMGGTGTVRVRVQRAHLPALGDGAGLIVEDEGPGVPEELAHRIFDPFFTTKEEGTGLGLSTVAGIVRESGGDIRVESRPDGGARFVAVLPAVRAPVTGRRSPPLEARRTGVPTRARILVMDDEPDVRRVVAAALRRFGHEVLLAADGDDALAVARTEGHRLDLVLADVRMPRRSGLETVRALRPLCPRARVVFTTGGIPGEDDHGASAGAVWLEKPFSIDELLDAVRRALGAGLPAPTKRRTGEGS